MGSSRAGLFHAVGVAFGVGEDGVVEGLDEVRGGEVADPVSGLDCGVAERDEEVGFAGAGGSDETHVLSGVDPLEAGQVVERRGFH